MSDFDHDMNAAQNDILTPYLGEAVSYGLRGQSTTPIIVTWGNENGQARDRIGSDAQRFVRLVTITIDNNQGIVPAESAQITRADGSIWHIASIAQHGDRWRVTCGTHAAEVRVPNRRVR